MNFTDKKPTVPGAYWWQDEDGVMLVHIKASPTGELWAQGTDCHEGRVERMGGLWSSRLVPVEEVKEAYHEGVGSGAAAGRPLYVGNLWSASRARRVVEGKETP